MGKGTPASGLLFICVAFFFVASMSAFGKAAGELPTAQLAFFQNFIAFLAFGPYVLISNLGHERSRPHDIKLHVLRAATGLLSQVFMFISVRHMDFVDAVLFSNSAPLFIPFIAWVWLKRKIKVETAVSLAIGFIGVVTILRPNRALFTHPASLFAVGSAAFSAFALLTVNVLSHTNSAKQILFYYFLFSALFTLPFAALHWVEPTSTQWIDLIAIGVTMALAQLFIILAYEVADAETIAPFNYTVVVFSGLIGWIVWHQRPDLLSVGGAVLVALGGILSTRSNGLKGIAHFGWLGRWHFFHWHLSASNMTQSEPLPER